MRVGEPKDCTSSGRVQKQLAASEALPVALYRSPLYLCYTVAYPFEAFSSRMVVTSNDPDIDDVSGCTSRIQSVRRTSRPQRDLVTSSC